MGRKKKWTLTVPKCFQCKWQKECLATETGRRSMACLWHHYSYQATSQYWDQWIDYDDPTIVGWVWCKGCETRMALCRFDKPPYTCALCGEEMKLDTEEASEEDN